jgi:hypothetical protein
MAGQAVCISHTIFSCGGVDVCMTLSRAYPSRATLLVSLGIPAAGAVHQLRQLLAQHLHSLRTSSRPFPPLPLYTLVSDPSAHPGYNHCVNTHQSLCLSCLQSLCQTHTGSNVDAAHQGIQLDVRRGFQPVTPPCAPQCLQNSTPGGTQQLQPTAEAAGTRSQPVPGHVPLHQRAHSQPHHLPGTQRWSVLALHLPGLHVLLHEHAIK